MAIYRVENPPNPEKIGEKQAKYRKILSFAYLWSIFFAYFSPIFWISAFFYSVDGQGFCKTIVIISVRTVALRGNIFPLRKNFAPKKCLGKICEPSDPLQHLKVVILGAPNQKNSRRLELSISKNTPHGRLGQGPESVGPRFPAGLPFPVPEILEFVAYPRSTTPCSTPNFRRSLPSTLPSYFLGFPVSLFCSRLPGSQPQKVNRLFLEGYFANPSEKTLENAGKKTVIFNPENPYPPKFGGWRFTPQIWGVNLQKNTCFTVFSGARSLNLGGWNPHPPNLGGMGSQGSIFSLFFEVFL